MRIPSPYYAIPDGFTPDCPQVLIVMQLMCKSHMLYQMAQAINGLLGMLRNPLDASKLEYVNGHLY